MSKSRIGEIDERFREGILPVLMSWGLERHPNSRIYFGRLQFGYLYEFADTSDLKNIKLCNVGIFRKNSSISITAKKGIELCDRDQELKIIDAYRDKKFFTLARPLTLKRFFTSFADASFRLHQKKNETLDVAAGRLIAEVAQELPRLRKYLYS